MHGLPRQPVGAVSSEPLFRAPCVWAILVVWLLLAVPLFVAMPLNCDTALYDVQARTVLNGGVAYRDIVEPNLPGALWIHLGLRSLGGWSSEFMRGADLIVVATTLWLWAALCGRNDRVSPMVLLAAAAFYLTRNEWCHAQRDTWMLLPVGVALAIRLGRPVGCNDWPAVAEGICWGIAFWIKPHVVIPAATVMLLDSRSATLGAHLRDLLAVVAGGILAAIPGVVWLIRSGAWEHFWTMMLDWNPEYLAAGRARMSIERWVLMVRRFSPWFWIHAIAMPVAVTSVVRFLRRDQSPLNRRRALLCGVYAAWTVQSIFLQHALDYIHVPAVILALAVVGGHSWSVPVGIRRSLVVGFFVLATLATPFFRVQSLRQWSAVWSEGSTPGVRAALAHGNLPDWRHLNRVIEYLQSRQVKDGDVTCMNVHSVHVYNETQTRPSTRYWSVAMLQDLFAHRAACIADAVSESGHRFVVTESAEGQLLGRDRSAAWVASLRPVFATGTYLVFAVEDDQGQVAMQAR